MSPLGSLQNEADLKRFIERELGGLSLQRLGKLAAGAADGSALADGSIKTRHLDVSAVLGLVEDWHEVTPQGSGGEADFQNSWVNHTPSVHSPAAFYKDPFGVVHLRGLVKSGSFGFDAPPSGVIFTLPSSYRPAFGEHTAVVTNGVFGNTKIFGNSESSVAGSVQAQRGDNAWFSLDGITFKAEQ